MKCVYEKCSSCIHRKDCDYLVKIKELKGQIEWLEKCNLELGEMLGEANKTITELKSHCKAVDEVNEKMKNCENCKHQDYCYTESDNGLCEQDFDKWELRL